MKLMADEVKRKDAEIEQLRAEVAQVREICVRHERLREEANAYGDEQSRRAEAAEREVERLTELLKGKNNGHPSEG